jgi:hypothetical protein
MKSGFVNSVLRVASVAAIPLAALAISTPASAQRSAERQLFEWRGNVDQEIRVQMQGSRAAVMAMGPHEMTGYNNARPMSALPPVNGYVTVQMREGRGRADVVEQPTAQNGYTTVVRIRDTQSGAGAYDVAAFWEPNGAYGNGGYNNGGQYGNYGNDGNYGRYNTYPQTVIVQQPVYQPVYRDHDRDRGVQGGKALPAPQRSSVYQIPQRYPDRVTPNGGYQRGQAPVGRTLPSESRPAQPGKSLPTASRGASQPTNQSGKTLPSADQSNQQNHGWPRGH